MRQKEANRAALMAQAIALKEKQASENKKAESETTCHFYCQDESI